MSVQPSPRLADAKRAMQAADRVRPDGEETVHAGREFDVLLAMS
jgi:hypothetical protein